MAGGGVGNRGAKWGAVEQGEGFSAHIDLVFLVWGHEGEKRGRLPIAHLLGGCN